MRKIQNLHDLEFKWESMLKQIFPVSIPNFCVWEEKTAIVSIFNTIGSISHYASHVFLPGGGGIDIAEAKESIEEGCIEFFSDKEERRMAYIVKPHILTFQSFNNNHKWSYFRLETEYLKPSGIYENYEFKHEELTEITPGFYVGREVWDYGYYGYDSYKNQEKVLPESARLVNRCFEGSFVIFTKASPYNLSTKIDAYDGYHNMMSSDEFRKYISQCSHLSINRE